MIERHTYRMEDMASRLKKFRDDKKISQRELSRLTGIEQATLSRIEKGEMSLISPHVEKISKALGIPISKLLGITSNISPAQVGSKRVPILTYEQAASFKSAREFVEEDEVRDFVPIDLPHSVNTFALRIEDDSMEPTYSIGDVIVVDPDINPIKPGDYVFAIDDEDNCIFRRYRDLGINEEGNKVFELIPINKMFPPVRSDRHNFVIRGVMAEHRKYRKT